MNEMEGGVMSASVHSMLELDLEFKSVRTTLYKLIEAISGQVEPEQDELVVKIVLHLFESGKVRFISKS
jgi:hypothetical protein